MMRGLSCSDYTWPTLSHTVVMAVIADLGFSGVDVGVFHEATHVTLSSVVSAPHDRAQAVRSLAGAAGLEIADVFLTPDADLARLSPTSRAEGDWSRLRELFHAVLEFAREAGSGGVTLLPGVVEHPLTNGQAIELAAERLAVLVKDGAEVGLEVSVEPHVGSCIEDPASTKSLLDLCPGLTLTLDPSHYGYSGWGTERLAGLMPRTRHVQIRPGAVGTMQCRLRDNELDLDRFVTDLLSSGYRGWLASEFVWMEKWNCDRVDNTVESAHLAAYLTTLLDRGTSDGPSEEKD